MRTAVFIPLTLGVALLAASSVRAQAPRASIPTVLVATAINPIGGDFSKGFAVGRLPEGWNATLTPPPPAHLVGGYAFQSFRDIVVTYPRGVDGDAALTALLVKAGYHRADTLRARPDGGFAPPVEVELERTSSSWCNDSTVAVVARPDTTAYPRTWTLIAIRDPNSVRRCRGDILEPMRGAPMELPLPLLRAPRGVSVQGGGGSHGTNYQESTASTDTTISVDSLLLHYAAELRRGGWRQLGAPLLNANGGMVSFSARDRRGAEWRGALVVLATADRRDVIIRMRTGDGY